MQLNPSAAIDRLDYHPLPITKKALLRNTKARRKLLGDVYYVQLG